MAEMKTTALASWAGSNRMNAHRVGEMLSGLKWIGVVFAGGMSELAHISCRSIVVNDIHRHVINLADQIHKRGDELAKRLADTPFHPDVLIGCQDVCRGQEAGGFKAFGHSDSFNWAYAYFVCCWMGRSAVAGTDGEFKGNLSTRWNANGGDSNTRYRSAIKSLEEWQRIMQRCNFSTLDFREFLGNCKDEIGHGIYSDSPFPDAKIKYKHAFTEQDHIDLAMTLVKFRQAKVVVRHYDHPLIRKLYPADLWKWHEFAGRKQSNAEAPEVLITNKVSP